MPKAAAPDQTVVLLTEIRDLLRENQTALTGTKKAQQRSLIMKVAFNGAIVVFVAFATYYYYHTLVTSMGGS
jgi:hypothetical protein